MNYNQIFNELSELENKVIVFASRNPERNVSFKKSLYYLKAAKDRAFYLECTSNAWQKYFNTASTNDLKKALGSIPNYDQARIEDFDVMCFIDSASLITLENSSLALKKTKTAH
jgi:hypothetical protein